MYHVMFRVCLQYHHMRRIYWEQEDPYLKYMSCWNTLVYIFLEYLSVYCNML